MTSVAVQEPDCFAIGRGVAALLDFREGRFVGVFDAEQEAFDARLPVKMQDVGVAHDVAGARRADDADRHVLGNHGLAESAPGRLVDGRVLVREIDEFHAMNAVQPRDLCGKFLRVAMPPARPEPALPAIIAMMRTAP